MDENDPSSSTHTDEVARHPSPHLTRAHPIDCCCTDRKLALTWHVVREEWYPRIFCDVYCTMSYQKANEKRVYGKENLFLVALASILGLVLKLDQEFITCNRVARLDHDALDNTCANGAKDVGHLHGLDRGDSCTLSNNIAHLDIHRDDRSWHRGQNHVGSGCLFLDGHEFCECVLRWCLDCDVELGTQVLKTEAEREGIQVLKGDLLIVVERVGDQR